GLIAPLMCLTLTMPLIVSAMFGAGIQRSSGVQSISGWKRGMKLFTHGIVLLGITTLYLIFLGDMAIQPVRGRQTTNAVIRAIVGGPENIQHMRLFMFGMMWLFVSFIVTL